jgi:ATP-dependent Clp protease adaptor protein ClpS
MCRDQKEIWRAVVNHLRKATYADALIQPSAGRRRIRQQLVGDSDGGDSGNAGYDSGDEEPSTLMSTPVESPTVVPARPKPRTAQKPKQLPPFHVIILNDDHHSFEFVIHVLRQVFGFPVERAFELTHEAHSRGRAVVWTGPKEVAELKADQIKTFHERDLGPLDCVIEPAPGG